MRKIFATLAAILISSVLIAQQQQVVRPPAPGTDSLRSAAARTPRIADRVRSSRKADGLFTIYQDTATGSLQLYVKKNQLNKDYIYQSFSINGPTALFVNQSMHRSTFVFRIERAFDRLEVKLVNTEFYYDKANPISKTADVDIADAVVLAERVTAEDSLGYLINADG